MINVAINGYGRIGRNVHRQFEDRFGDSVQVVGINASTSSEMRAYLLKYDSLHRKFKGEISVKDENNIIVNGKTVRVVKEKDPSKCPWKELDVDIVVEATGKFRTRELANGHLLAGAKRVIVTAPMKDDTPTFVKGVNHKEIKPDMEIVSNASCTTNCIAPVIKVIDETFEIENLLVNSVHAFTASQNLLDNNNKEGDLRRTRAATLSIIPTKTGAVKACADIFPHLKGKIDGMAFRVPVPTVSCAYMAFFLKNNTSTEEINSLLKSASQSGPMVEVLDYSDDECVSIDFQTNPHSSIVDALSTKVVDGKAAQILSWYDNEWGYAMRVTEMVVEINEMMV